MKINALGKACPTPVLMAKKQLESNDHNFEILVDNPTAVANLTRFATNQGLEVETTGQEPEFCVHIFGDGFVSTEEEENIEMESCSCNSASRFVAYFIGKDHIGEGEGELGFNLLKMAVYTLSEADRVPQYLLFMNSGVKFVVNQDEQIELSLQHLIERGCKILVCGTCLNFYQIAEQLKHGTVSNMYDILGAMEEVGKVISL
jgi:selenium metabolism protein YedF